MQAVGGSTTESEVKAGGESSTTESVHDFLAGGESTIQDEGNAMYMTSWLEENPLYKMKVMQCT